MQPSKLVLLKCAFLISPSPLLVEPHRPLYRTDRDTQGPVHLLQGAHSSLHHVLVGHAAQVQVTHGNENATVMGSSCLRCVCVFVCLHMCACTCTCMCVFVAVFVCMCMCACVCVCSW